MKNRSDLTFVLIVSIATLVVCLIASIVVAPLVGMTFVQLAPWAIFVAALIGGVAYAFKADKQE